MWLRVGVAGGTVYVNDDSEAVQTYSGLNGEGVTEETNEKEKEAVVNQWKIGKAKKARVRGKRNSKGQTGRAGYQSCPEEEESLGEQGLLLNGTKPTKKNRNKSFR